MYPKLVALDIDWTLIKGTLDVHKLGKGRGASFPPEDNLELENEWKLRDRTNHHMCYWLFNDVPAIITDILRNGADIAIVSKNSSKALCDRVLWWFKAEDPRTGKIRPIIDMVKFDEVYNNQKTVHMQRIQEWTGYDFSDMILFDDNAANNLVRVVQGVTFQVSRDQQGLTWGNYQDGIALWRRCKEIRSPYLGQNPSSYPKRMFIGYSGMDEGTIQLLTQGKNRVDLKESARWGYASYVTDNPALAKFFANWIKKDAFGANAKTSVCEIWVRDKDLFLAMNKIWVPERNSLMTNVKTNDASKIGWKQEDRDRQVAEWGVQAPYILFSRHFKMNGMPRIPKRRWNEMVIYSQTQDALLLAFPMTSAQLEEKINAKFRPYAYQIQNWNIRIPPDTVADFQQNGDEWIRV